MPEQHFQVLSQGCLHMLWPKWTGSLVMQVGGMFDQDSQSSFLSQNSNG